MIKYIFPLLIIGCIPIKKVEAPIDLYIEEQEQVKHNEYTWEQEYIWVINITAPEFFADTESFPITPELDMPALLDTVSPDNEKNLFCMAEQGSSLVVSCVIYDYNSRLFSKMTIEKDHCHTSKEVAKINESYVEVVISCRER